MSAPAAPRSGLRRFTAPRPPAVERCELCAVPVAPEHRHLVDVERRALACACPACAALFEREGSGGVKYRSVPRRYLTDPVNPLGEGAWALLRIPIGVAFLLHNSALGQVVACFPGPAGVTESEVDPEVWRRFVAVTPLAAELRPDVEALLVRRTGGHRDCHLVPVDAAYALVGRMRTYWQGFDGGAEAHAELDAFFADVARQSRPLAPAKGVGR
ncbi:DUF5947 family protein [Streptacidiphilus jiangxiensis]|uniref:Uncharacterized protein n=1 Tax=Streptacidiphilus jiangxiensis TaxID=235985 RepID=A0A1H7NE87_STRJI|nr:DUF5947 family protein [Streptacidiphilus jiangxiensis]SEL21641.1 hypothetical protein SAMN05414137_106335 [Streptacidiphilus jiangxiensis]